MAASDHPTVEEWLLSSGLSDKSVSKLLSSGYNTMQLFMVCTQDDIDEIVKEFNLSITEKLKLKCAVNKLLEVKTDKLQIIDPLESSAMSKMQDKLLLFEDGINNINKMNLSINEQHKYAEKLINDIFYKIECKLNERKKELQGKLLTLIRVKHKILSKQHDEINENFKKANDIKKECHRLINNNNKDRKTFILNKQKEIDEIKISNDGEPRVSSNLLFDFDNDYKHLLHTISQFGCIKNGKQQSSNHQHQQQQQSSSLHIIDDDIDDFWDIETKGDNIKINKENKTVICNEIQSYCYRSAFGHNIYNKGSHHWKLKIIQCNDGYCAWNMLIGIMKIGKQIKSFPRNSHFTSNDNGYGFIGNLAHLTNAKDGGHGSDRKYGQKFINNGDIIDVYLDLDKFTLSYKINSVNYGIAFDNLEKTKYCLAVTFCGNNNQLKMLKYDHQTHKN